MDPHSKHSEQSIPLLEGEIRLIGGLNERLFRLLAAIEKTGSINRAAKDVGLSYKGAWEMVERANNLCPQVLVSTAVGGRHGGGTKLTATGRELLELFTRLQEEHRRFLATKNRELADNPNLVFLLRRLNSKASERNQLFGKVTAIRIGAVTVEVSITLKGGETIISAITKESADAFGLKYGDPVMALIKAPFVMVVKDFGGYRLSERNQLKGTVKRIQRGSVNSEVVIELAGGDSVAAIITTESLEAMGLREGETAWAVIKTGSVILGVEK
ncbi:molybdenum transport protein ModE [Methylocaldum marinum]|uniref:Molybdenum transport protein ModE n=1 Tax=Methylocaldum marinum TaxID=1432792 RepID=A0A250KU53_9GAMM|nr:TOBE domain-containing protein [Methylocaldum marinum]BBA35066.1 molybdenum transport protein ModE [Methylocaldum marinum]